MLDTHAERASASGSPLAHAILNDASLSGFTTLPVALQYITRTPELSSSTVREVTSTRSHRHWALGWGFDQFRILEACRVRLLHSLTRRHCYGHCVVSSIPRAVTISDMTLLLLGAGGFIGSHLVEHLLAHTDHNLVGFDVSADKLEGIRKSSRFEFHLGDIRSESKLLGKLVRASDVVVDLIAYANPSIYVSAPLEVFELNFVQNMNVVHECVAHRKRLIQYSSAEVYGKAGTGTLCREDATDSVFGPIQKQRWIYASAKALLERLLYAHGLAGDLEYCIVRPFNFVGPRLDYLVPAAAVGGPRVFPHFMSALLTGGPIRLVDGGHVHRTFLHIEDASRAFQTLLDKRQQTRNGIFNVGNPESNVTIRELALLMLELYEELTGRHAASAIETISGEDFYGPGYEDGDRLPPDISKMRALGWQPRHDLRSALRDAMVYYLDERNAEVNRGYAGGAAVSALGRPRVAMAG